MKNREVLQSMEFVLQQLHTEWERSGVAKKEVILDMAQMNKVMAKMAQKIGKKQEQLEKNLPFHKSVILSHENYILLRTMKKFITAKHRLEKSGAVFARILLDKEETKVFLDIESESLPDSLK